MGPYCAITSGLLQLLAAFLRAVLSWKHGRVGEMEGDEEGGGVGVGRELGAVDGAEDGTGVCRVGTGVGSSEGAAVGAEVGGGVGGIVGILVGPIEGDMLGMGVGTCEGDMLGALVGACVVGNVTGAKVGLSDVVLVGVREGGMLGTIGVVVGANVGLWAVEVMIRIHGERFIGNHGMR